MAQLRRANQSRQPSQKRTPAHRTRRPGAADMHTKHTTRAMGRKSPCCERVANMPHWLSQMKGRSHCVCTTNSAQTTCRESARANPATDSSTQPPQTTVRVGLATEPDSRTHRRHHNRRPMHNNAGNVDNTGERATHIIETSGNHNKSTLQRTHNTRQACGTGLGWVGWWAGWVSGWVGMGGRGGRGTVDGWGAKAWAEYPCGHATMCTCGHARRGAMGGPRAGNGRATGGQ